MKIDDYLNKFKIEFNNQLAEDRRKLIKEYECAKEEYTSCCWNSIKVLIEKCKEQQERGKKGLIRYIGVHFLRASARTRDYEYKIAMYTDELFQDREEVAVYWSSPYFKQIAEDSAKRLAGMLRKEFIRISDYDIKLFCEEYFFELMKFIPLEIIESLEKVIREEALLKLKHETQVAFLKGEYLLAQEQLINPICLIEEGVV